VHQVLIVQKAGEETRLDEATDVAQMVDLAMKAPSPRPTVRPDASR
jgi:hypothetical protein